MLETVDSTNDEVRRRARGGGLPGLVVAADHQSAGRGRRGRRWHSAPGLGLYISVLLRPAVRVDQVTRWTLGAAVAGCESCRELAGCPATIAWPNDLLAGSLKLGGVLTELRSAGGQASDLVIGFGLNVHHQPGDWPAELAGVAASLRQVSSCGIVVEREALAVEYLRRLSGIVTDLSHGRWGEVASRWEALAPRARGASVRVSGGSRGVTAGLDPWGALQVRTGDGRLLRVHEAESVTAEED